MKRAKRKDPANSKAKPERHGRLKDNSLAEQAFEKIKERILTLYFLPGQYLNEASLCAMLNVGRTPIHQALQRLELEGLVEIMPRKGVVVRPDDISEILKILDSRAAVEAELASCAARNATAKDLQELKSLVRMPSGGGQSADIDKFLAADRAFHRKFAEIADNPVLAEFARNVHERSIRYWYLHLWQTIQDKSTSDEHSAIASAIAKRNGPAAAKAVRDHIDSLRARYMKAQQTSRRIPPHRDR